VSPIVYELGLVIVGLVVFVVWQTVTLRRDMRITRQRRADEALREGSDAAPTSDRDPLDTAPPQPVRGIRQGSISCTAADAKRGTFRVSCTDTTRSPSSPESSTERT